MQRSRTVAALLPNGVNLWFELKPAAVPAAALDAAVGLAERRRARIVRQLRAQAAATRQLADGGQRDSARLAQGRARIERQTEGLRKAALGRVGRRLQREAIDTNAKQRAEWRRQWTLVQGNARRDGLDWLLVASAAPLMAAYGQRGNPLSINNLTIALGLGVWLFGETVAERLAGRPAAEPRPPSAWSYGAPLANLFTGWWLLHGLQHERFVSGTVALDSAGGGGGFKVESWPVPLTVGTVSVAMGDTSLTPHLYSTESTATVTEQMPTQSLAQYSTARSMTPTTQSTASGAIQEDRYRARIDLSRYIAPDSFPDFASYANVPALATIATIGLASDTVSATPQANGAPQAAGTGPEIGLKARVHRGVLFVSVRVRARVPVASDPTAAASPSPLLAALRVAWAVDTRKPGT